MKLGTIELEQERGKDCVRYGKVQQECGKDCARMGQAPWRAISVDG
jgi:hypothetical protein